MASNIRFVFFKKGDDVILKVQYNESDLKLPVEPFCGVYYRWSDFKGFYSELIAEALQQLNN